MFLCSCIVGVVRFNDKLRNFQHSKLMKRTENIVLLLKMSAQVKRKTRCNSNLPILPYDCCDVAENLRLKHSRIKTSKSATSTHYCIFQCAAQNCITNIQFIQSEEKLVNNAHFNFTLVLKNARIRIINEHAIIHVICARPTISCVKQK